MRLAIQIIIFMAILIAGCWFLETYCLRDRKRICPSQVESRLNMIDVYKNRYTRKYYGIPYHYKKGLQCLLQQ